ncbi:MAG: homoserine kinase [Clostridia bacterium]|nr:homoserine kinase [Clostridia bacterium]
MLKVRVPATSANMGPGFDSMGVALNLYNYVTVEEIDSGLVIDITDETGKYIRKDEKNLVYQSMKAVFDKVGYTPKGLHLILENNIMVTRGLGSSSAGIVSGLLLGNALAGNPLSKDTLLAMAVDIEGHGDNVTPALMGGFCINVNQNGKIRYVSTPVKEDLMFAALVPDFYLQTKKARSVLPRSVTMWDAVYNTGRSALLAASIMSGKYENIRAAVGDKLHQRYRKRLIPNMDALFQACYDKGALGVYLSGAGPTIVAIVHREKAATFSGEMHTVLSKRMKNWTLHMLEADNQGAQILDEHQ